MKETSYFSDIRYYILIFAARYTNASVRKYHLSGASLLYLLKEDLERFIGAILGLWIYYKFIINKIFSPCQRFRNS